MRLIILTTGSVRRRYFVQTLQSSIPVTRVFVETGELIPPFETFHTLEDQSKEYEKNRWFNGRSPKFDDIASTEYFRSLNDPEAVRAIAATRPDMMIVFGTKKLSPSVINICPLAAFNVHTGDPEQYRGLDAHLWSIYHRDFDLLVVTIQRLALELDQGEIVAKAPVSITPGMRMYQLRSASTEAITGLFQQVMAEFQSRGKLEARPQQTIGRYYSFMPSVLKELCTKRFEKFTSSL